MCRVHLFIINRQPLDAITSRAKADNTVVSSSTSDTDLGAAITTATGKDVVFVFISADSGEGYLTVENNAGDRNDLQAWHNGVRRQASSD